MKRHASFVRGAGAVLLSAAIAGCAGGGGSTNPVTAGGGNGAHGVKATLHMIVGGPHHHRAGRRGRKHKFVSPSTNGVLVQMYPHGAARIPANLIVSAAVDVSSGSAACGGTTGYPRTCAATVFIPPTGATLDDVLISAYDAAPSGGRISPSANLLGIGSLLNQAIVAAAANSLNVFLGGVIDSLGGIPAYAQMPADGSANTVSLVVDPQDYGNNTITAGKNDPFANPIVVTANETGGSGHASITVGSGSPAQEATLSTTSDLANVVLHYDGKSPAGYALSATLTAPKVGGSGGATSTLLVTTLALSSTSAEYTPGALALNGNGDVLTLNFGETNAPSTPTYVVTPEGCDAIAEPLGLKQSSGTGSVFIFARQVSSANGCTITVSDGTSSLAVAVSNSYSGVEGTPTIAYFSAGGITPTAMTVGPQGDIWFAGGADIGSIPATGAGPVAASYPLPTNISTLVNVQGLTTGPDGNLWYTADNGANTPQLLAVGNFSTGAHTGTNYATTFLGFPFGIVPGPDGNLWFTQLRVPTAQNAIGSVTTAGTFTNYPLTSMPYTQEVTDIVSGPDGNLWFTEQCARNLGNVTTGGTITENPVTGMSGTYDVTVGSDGALWYTDGFANWGRMTTSGNASYGLSGLTGGSPRGITTGPDGAIWFVEGGQGAGGIYYIGRVNPSDDSQTEISLGTSAPTGPIVAGPDGALWFASGTNVGRIALQTSSAIRRHHVKRPRAPIRP